MSYSTKSGFDSGLLNCGTENNRVQFFDGLSEHFFSFIAQMHYDSKSALNTCIYLVLGSNVVKLHSLFLHQVVTASSGSDLLFKSPGVFLCCFQPVVHMLSSLAMRICCWMSLWDWLNCSCNLLNSICGKQKYIEMYLLRHTNCFTE